MTSRYFPSGRFAYSMGYKNEDSAYEAMCEMINGCELSPGEGRLESYNSSGTPHKRVTRWAITTRMD